MRYVLFLLVFISVAARSQPANDACDNAMLLSNLNNYCSADAQFNNSAATSSGVSIPSSWTPHASSDGLDVWFKFTAVAYDINISVTGDVSGGGSRGGTMLKPLVALYSTDDCSAFSQIIGSLSVNGNAALLYVGGLTVGQEYKIRVSAANNNTGTFKLCVNNYNPGIEPGQDCSTAALLCSKQGFTNSRVAGAGNNNQESAETCLGSERNTAWYKFIAANAGTLTFVITPSVSTDDFDWVLYDLGTTGDCSGVNAANAIRCAAGHGVDNSGCPNEPLYYKTGMNLTETDQSEAGSCGDGQNGFVQYINMVQGHIYALLIDNFSNANNGFSIEFGGTGEFLGPQSKMSFVANNQCSANQSFTFTNESAYYSGLRWNFGAGADKAVLTTAGPHTVTYSSPGIKTVVLEAIGEGGCFTVATKTFAVGVTPAQPVIVPNKTNFCIKDTIRLTTTEVPGLTYSWTGPSGFTSDNASVAIPVKDFDVAGEYILSVSSGDCFASSVSITIPPVLINPTAAFRSVPDLPAKLSWPVTITFFNDSRNADTYLWDFGDGSTSAETDPMHTYTTAGDYDVTLTAFKSTVCSSSVMKGKFVIRAIGTLFIPNTFTPNGDNINDEFVVTVTNLLSYHLRIFNRWGDLLFETNSIFGNWNGLHNGNPVPMGTYYYVIDGADLNGSKIKESGSVTVIR